MAMTDALLLILRGEMPLHLPFCCLGRNRQRPFPVQRPTLRTLQSTTQPHTLLRTTPFFQTSLGFPVFKSVPAPEQSIWKSVPRLFLENQFKKYYAPHFVSGSCALVPWLVFVHRQIAAGSTGTCIERDRCCLVESRSASMTDATYARLFGLSVGILFALILALNAAVLSLS